MGGFGTGLNALYLNGSSFGMGSGLNVQSIVQTLTQAAQANETQYTDEQTLYNSQISALNNMSGLLTSLQTATQALQDPAGPLSARAATSSNSNVVTATASSGIATGNYSIVVNNLASTAVLSSQPQTSATSTISAGTIQYTIGGNNYSISVSSTDTLNSLVSEINSGNYGVTANVINDSQGSILALTGNTSGSAGAITSLADTSGLGLGTAVQGKDASLSINGVPVFESSNTVTGAVPGVTFTLTGTSAAPVSVAVGQDVNQASTAINSFVSAYNAVIQAVNTQFSYTAGASSQPPLFSDGALQQVQATLATDINYFTSGNNGISGLSSIGVSLQQDGTLSVNSAALSSALSSNPSAVATLFQGPDYMTGLAGGLYDDLANLTDPTNGVLALDENGINQELKDVTQTIDDFNANLLLQEQQWTAEYSQVNATLQELPLLISQVTGQSTAASSTSSNSSSS